MFDERNHCVGSRIVSISQPHVRPIVRGKAKSPVEFVPKYDVSIDEKGHAAWRRLRRAIQRVRCVQGRRRTLPRTQGTTLRALWSTGSTAQGRAAASARSTASQCAGGGRDGPPDRTGSHGDGRQGTRPTASKSSGSSAGKSAPVAQHCLSHRGIGKNLGRMRGGLVSFISLCHYQKKRTVEAWTFQRSSRFSYSSLSAVCLRPVQPRPRAHSSISCLAFASSPLIVLRKSQ